METVPGLKSYFSPKKTKLETTSPTEPKIVESHSKPTSKDVTHDTSSHESFNVVSSADLKGGTIQNHSQTQSNEVTPTEPPPHVDESTSLRNERTWACSQCTYIHIGAMKFNYLACEVCGSPRIITDTVDRDVVCEDERKRKTIL